MGRGCVLQPCCKPCLCLPACLAAAGKEHCLCAVLPAGQGTHLRGTRTGRVLLTGLPVGQGGSSVLPASPPSPSGLASLLTLCPACWPELASAACPGGSLPRCVPSLAACQGSRAGSSQQPVQLPGCRHSMLHGQVRVAAGQVSAAAAGRSCSLQCQFVTLQGWLIRSGSQC